MLNNSLNESREITVSEILQTYNYFRKFNENDPFSIEYEYMYIIYVDYLNQNFQVSSST